MRLEIDPNAPPSIWRGTEYRTREVKVKLGKGQRRNRRKHNGYRERHVSLADMVSLMKREAGRTPEARAGWNGNVLTVFTNLSF